MISRPETKKSIRVKISTKKKKDGLHDQKSTLDKECSSFGFYFYENMKHKETTPFSSSFLKRLQYGPNDFSEWNKIPNDKCL